MPRRRTPSRELVAAAAARLGFDELYPWQREAIDQVLAGHDVLAVMPTGSGKSAIYQVAGALLDGPTVVVSPLVALQRDQVAALAEHEGAPAAAELNASLGERVREARLDALEHGELEYLLLAPEQLARPETLAELQEAPPSLLVVDEAHCISEWGHDFRPDYLRLGALAAELGSPQVLALTATAAPPVREEIVERLRMCDARVLVRGFDRPEIHLAVSAHVDARTHDEELLQAVVDGEGPGIVYAATRRGTEELAAALRERGVAAAAYHAGLSRRARDAAQDAFMHGETRVVVATIAFGMGIDKHDVRWVFHAQPSASVDAYYQEIGRAGRDREPARAVLFYRPADIGSVRFRAGVVALEVQDVERVASELQARDEPVEPPELVHPEAGLTGSKVTAAVRRLQDLGVADVLADGHVSATGDFDPTAVALEAVESQDARRAYERSRIDMLRTYAELRDCRRRFLLEYFGEPHPDPCGNCDNCEAGLIAETMEEPFPLGARVRHEAWGVGTVQRYQEDRMVVLFDTEGYRTLDVDIALERGLLRPA